MPMNLILIALLIIASVLLVAQFVMLWANGQLKKRQNELI